MRADIAVGERAEDRVGQGVERDVAVGMADDAAGMRDRDAAEHDPGAGAEGVDVVAGSDPDIAEHEARLAGESAVGRGDVLGRGELDVAGFARNDRDGNPGPFGDGGVVGEGSSARSRPGHARPGSSRIGSPAASRRPARPRAARSRSTRPSASTDFSVAGTGRAGTTASARSSAETTRSISAGGAKGRAASWIRTRPGFGLRQGCGARRGPSPAGSRRRPTGGSRRLIFCGATSR